MLCVYYYGLGSTQFDLDEPTVSLAFFRVSGWRKYKGFFFLFLEYEVLYQAGEHLGLLLLQFSLRNDRGLK